MILDGATRNAWIGKPYNEGSDVNLICEVEGGRPPPRLTWYLDNTVIDDSYHYNADTGMTINHLTYPKIGRQHLKSRLICQASNTNLATPQVHLLILDVNRKSSIVTSCSRMRRASTVVVVVVGVFLLLGSRALRFPRCVHARASAVITV